jgi:hypothetical protein
LGLTFAILRRFATKVFHKRGTCFSQTHGFLGFFRPIWRVLFRAPFFLPGTSEDVPKTGDFRSVRRSRDPLCRHVACEVAAFPVRNRRDLRPCAQHCRDLRVSDCCCTITRISTTSFSTERNRPAQGDRIPPRWSPVPGGIVTPPPSSQASRGRSGRSIIPMISTPLDAGSA